MKGTGAGIQRRKQAKGKNPAKADGTEAPAARPAEEAEAERRDGSGPEGFYAELFTSDEMAALARIATEPSLDDEATLLKIMIRRAAAQGADLNTISRAVSCLAATLKVQHAIRGEAAKNLEDALAKALDEIAIELGL